MGFTMSPEEAQALIDKDPRNADVLFPYLGGEDLNQSSTQTAPRWIINFVDWPEEKARQYADCFSIVEEKVKPERQERKANGEFRKRKPLPQRYWIYADKCPKLYRAIAPMERVLAISRVSKTIQPVFVPTGQVLSQKRPSSSPTTTTSTSVCSLIRFPLSAGRCASHPRCGQILATRLPMCSIPFPSRRTATPSQPLGGLSMLAVPSLMVDRGSGADRCLQPGP